MRKFILSLDSKSLFIGAIFALTLDFISDSFAVIDFVMFCFSRT